MPTQRLTPTERKRLILKAAVSLASRYGMKFVTRDRVARRAHCSIGLVTLYYEDMDKLRNAVMRYAAENKILNIIAEGLALRHHAVKDLPDGLKKAALATVVG